MTTTDSAALRAAYHQAADSAGTGGLANLMRRLERLVSSPDFAQRNRKERHAIWALGAAVQAEIDHRNGTSGRIDGVIGWYAQAVLAAPTEQLCQTRLQYAAALANRHRPEDIGTAVRVLWRVLDDPRASWEQIETAVEVLAPALLGRADRTGRPTGLIANGEKLAAAIERLPDDAAARALTFRARLLWRADRLSHERSHVDAALHTLAQAEALADRKSATWATVLVERGNLLLDLSEENGDADLAKQATTALRRASKCTECSPGDRLEIEATLGAAQYVESRLRSSLPLLKSAVNRLEGVYNAWLESDVDRRWRTAVNLAAALHEVFDWTGSLDKLEHAIELLEECRDLEGRRPASVSMNLGVLLSARFRFTGDPLDALRATDVLDDAAKTGNDVAAARSSEGNAWADLYQVTGDPAHLSAAIAAKRSAVRNAIEGTLDWAICQMNLGVSLVTRGVHRGRRKDIEEALTCHRLALRSTARGIAHRPRMHLALAEALVALDSRLVSTNRSVRASAARHYRLAIESATAVAPEVAIEGGNSWGTWALGRRSWREALRAFDNARQASVALQRTQLGWDHRELWLRAVQGIAQGSALAHARLNEFSTAREVLEAGRLQLLANRMSRPRPYTLESKDSTAPRVYLAVTEVGSMALFENSVEWLDSVRTTDVERQIQALRSAYISRERDRSAWQETLMRVSRWTAEQVTCRLVPHLSQKSPIVEVVPTGYVAALPLTAAWEQSSEAFSIEDSRTRPDLVLAISLSLAAPAPDRLTHRLAAAADPRPSHGPPLPNGRLEVRAAGRRLPGDVLVGRKATPLAVTAALRTAFVAHLACHGEADRERPLNSRLRFAGGDIDVASLIGKALGSLDFVILSACDSAVIGDPTPDEAIGLPAALLAAGARGVVASSWAVDDLAATTFFCRFWETWDPAAHVAVSLARTRAWMRQVTNEELAQSYAFHRARQKRVNVSALRIWNTRRPFQSAVHWAAFSYHTA